MKDFRDLKAWEKAHRLALSIYRETSSFPDGEKYRLISQMRRAAVSVAANIAEGCGRGTDADFARFLQIALGSAAELEYLVVLARDLSLVDLEANFSLHSQVIEAKKMLTSLCQKLRAER
jgi:four helix bundle protein